MVLFLSLLLLCDWSTVGAINSWRRALASKLGVRVVDWKKLRWRRQGRDPDQRQSARARERIS
jgi:hypothetical protein